MRPEGIAAAARELKRAERAHKRIQHADDVEDAEDAEDAWSDFLAHAGNIYAKLRAACYGHPRDWGWFAKKLDERARDPLLLYVHKARNCETHRLEPTTKAMPEGAQLMRIPGMGRRYVSYPQHLYPLPVSDEHGKVYPVPTSHKGHEMVYLDAQLIAFIATLYFQGLIKEASSRLR